MAFLCEVVHNNCDLCASIRAWLWPLGWFLAPFAGANSANGSRGPHSHHRQALSSLTRSVGVGFKLTPSPRSPGPYATTGSVQNLMLSSGENLSKLSIHWHWQRKLFNKLKVTPRVPGLDPRGTFKFSESESVRASESLL